MVFLRVNRIQAGANHRNRCGLCVALPFLPVRYAIQCALVCCAVDAQRQTGDNCQPGTVQCFGKVAGVLQALHRRVAAADDRYRIHGIQISRAHRIQQQRRVGDIQQRCGVMAIAQRENATL